MNRLINIISFVVLVVLVSATSLAASEIEEKERVVPELKAYRINPHAPTIDGNLDDPVWKSPGVQLAREFTQIDPDEGVAASESTLVTVAYDDQAIYVAFWCYDSEPDKIDRQLVRRDRFAQADLAVLRLDPYHDHQSGYAFYLNAAGVQCDKRYYNDGWSDKSWDAVWEGDVKMQPWGWTAEMRIPYNCLRFTDKEEHVWGIDFERQINRKGEGSRWAFVPSEEGGFVSNFGHLKGIHSIKPSRHLEILPYVVSSAETEPKGQSNPDGRSFMGNAGFDIKYALSSNLIVDATINPDFGQVELDQPVLNLSVYETWFPERRPFFIEGSDLFNTNYRLFYSRRIGRPPSNDVEDPDLVDFYTDYPKSTTILGAAKLTGKLASGTSVAVLSAVTDEEKASYQDTLSRHQTGVVEPRAGYTVMRVKQDVLHNSFVGGMMTLASQDRGHPAVAGAFDWRLFTNNGMWQTNGQAIFTRVDNENVGFGIDANFEKAAGEHVRGFIGLTIKDPNFHINRLGYTNRNNARHVMSWVQYRTQDDWWIIRNSWSNINTLFAWNYDGVCYQLGGDWNTQVEFTNYWSLSGGVNVQGERYSDLETRGNGLWEWPVYPTFSWWLSLNTDGRKKVSFTWNPGGGSDRGGSWWANYIGVALRPRSNLEFEFGTNFVKNKNVLHWVENVEDTSVFAELDRNQITLHASASIVFNRNLSCQLSAQGLISGLDYQNYRYYQGGQNYSDPVSGFDHDYNYSALNSTLLIRWEYHPGSTLYLVWTRSRSEVDDMVNDLSLSRDLDRFFSAGSENLFLVKASYWWSI